MSTVIFIYKDKLNNNCLTKHNAHAFLVIYTGYSAIHVRINALYSQILYVVAFSLFSGCFQILMNIYVISYMNKYISALSIWYVKKLFYLFYIYLRSIRLNSQLHKLLCQGCMVPDILLDITDYTFDHNMMEDILKIKAEITIVWLTISVLNTKTWCFVFSLFLIL